MFELSAAMQKVLKEMWLYMLKYDKLVEVSLKNGKEEHKM